MLSIGKIIENKLREKGISVSEFARRINTNRNNVYDIFRRDSIDTLLLQKISTVLEHDFFQYFNSNIVSESFPTYTNEETYLKQKISELEKELLFFKEIISDKNRIIALLEQKLKEIQK